MNRGKMDCYGVTDIGRVRESNQDQFLIADLRKSITIHHSSLGYDEHTDLSGASRAKLLMVADGMGGHSGGQRASWMAVEGIVRYLLTNLHWPINCEPEHEADFFRGLHASLAYSQEQIREISKMSLTQNHMGTTLTMAWVVWPSTYLIHVGDSRAYLFRKDRLKQLSQDQTLAQALVDGGLVEAGNCRRYANILTSALGCTSNMEPLYGKFELQGEDKLLLCSDGLTKQLTDLEIEKVLSSSLHAEEACRRLVDAANNAGGNDNITVVIAGFSSGTPQIEAAMSEHADLNEQLAE